MNPQTRSRFQTAEQRREYAEGLVRFDLLAEEAVRRGLANVPDVVEATKRIMVQQLLKRELDDAAGKVPEAALRRYYDEHITDYVKPAMTRLSHLYFDKAHRTEADVLLARVKGLPTLDYAAFAHLAHEHSEDVRSRELDGDLRYLSDDELSSVWGAALPRAAARLEKVGDVTPQLVEGDKGLHILKLQGRQPTLNLSFEQARPSIQLILAAEARRAKFQDLLERLKRDGKLEFDDASLAAMVVDLKAPALESTVPAPGFISNQE
jgi:peptidyl-prolyl cis-trans isomerase C